MKTGRPRLAIPHRQPNGQRSRARRALAAFCYYPDETEREATATAHEARMRQTGLPLELAKLPEAGSAVGRLWIAGDLTRGQYEAALYFGRARDAYLRALSAPGLPREPREGPGASDPDAAVRQAIADKARYVALVEWLRQGGGELLAELSVYVLMDFDPTEPIDGVEVMSPIARAQRIGVLRRALDRVDSFMREARR